jgi:hypothetical protein
LIGRSAVVFSLVVSFAAEAGCGGDCPDQDEVFLLANSSTSGSMLVEACQDPARMDCLPLCESLLGPSPFTDRIDSCALLPDQGNGFTAVHVRWESLCE